MSKIKYKPQHTKDEQCVIDCPAGFDECLECGACEHCEDEALLEEENLPPSWQRFIEKNRKQI